MSWLPSLRVRATQTIWPPSAASAFAMASPMPRLAPETMTHCPSNFPTMFLHDDVPRSSRRWPIGQERGSRGSYVTVCCVSRARVSDRDALDVETTGCRRSGVPTFRAWTLSTLRESRPSPPQARTPEVEASPKRTRTQSARRGGRRDAIRSDATSPAPHLCIRDGSSGGGATRRSRTGT